MEQSEALDNVSVGMLRAYETSSLVSLAHQIHIENTEQGTIIACSQQGRHKSKYSRRVVSTTGSNPRDEEFTHLTSESDEDNVGEETTDSDRPSIQDKFH